MSLMSFSHIKTPLKIVIFGGCHSKQLWWDFVWQNAPVSVSVSVFRVGITRREKEESLKLVGVSGFFLELLARFELATSSLPRMRSTG